MKAQTSDLVSQIDIDDFSKLTPKDQADTINAALLEPLEQYKLSTLLVYRDLEEFPEFPEVSEECVQKTLVGPNIHKASGPDEIPNWLLKDFSDVLAQPITPIINTSYYEQRLPTMWNRCGTSTRL